MQRILVLIAVALGAFLLSAGPLGGQIDAGLAILVLVGVLWVTEALPVTITALLVPVLAALLHVLDVKSAMANFANPIIYLFLGGFALASALKEQGLDRAMASAVMRLAGGRFWLSVLLLFLAAAFLSMWISNTATAAMMLPLALGLFKRLDEEATASTQIFVLLGIAYSASLGGMGTLVGSPPNAIAAGYLHQGFDDWLKVGLPMVAILLPLAWLVLYWQLRPELGQRVAVRHEPFEWSRQRLLTLALFGVTVLCWIFSKPLGALLGGVKDLDSLVALTATVLVGALGLTSWKSLERDVDWGVLLLFGGGLTLSAVLKATGTSAWLAQGLSSLTQGAPVWLLYGLIALFVVFLTELASNTASAALLVPLFGGIAQALGLPVANMAVLIAIAASCAFMLPVATPPNAIVFGTGLVPQKTMMRTGLWLNLACVLVLTVVFGH
ncbi:DASS family sodium-coupled anion symporter [Gallaecimonas kandeliae]|uniref:SLC13 family permease n=1 Tax=Gallaecimonas kandeliae TaxID=3029055 RepID=UPI002647B838|nr:DASS family sodium-coupled anion symporter [Gallaecimonas kandeliae]WKE67207.1 DASS family sodium-coupled anion symporter [Gallaecimonas kandeliae]